MFVRLTREQLHALVWKTPITKLAAQYRLSDVALHKICRKHEVPTPPAGYWMKKQYDKPVRITPLPKVKSAGDIVIHTGAASDENETVSRARAMIAAGLENPSPLAGPSPLIERTMTRLRRARPDAAGLVHADGRGLIGVSVRPASLDRVESMLTTLLITAAGAGLEVDAGTGAAVFCWEHERVTFVLEEVTDRLPHEPTAKEPAAVATWQQRRDATRRHGDYWYDWGEPKIPKWEQRFQGRLAIQLEEVRARSESHPWGTPIRGRFVETKVRDLGRSFPRIVETAAAIAVVKQENTAYEERRKVTEADRERKRIEAERQLRIERERLSTLGALLIDLRRLHDMRDLLREVDFGLRPTPGVSALRSWINLRRDELEGGFRSEELEKRLGDGSGFSAADIT